MEGGGVCSFGSRRAALARRLAGALALVLGCGLSAGAVSQPVPKLAAVSREWFQRGTTNEIVISGQNLSALGEYRISGDDGVTITARPRPTNHVTVIESSLGGIVADQGIDPGKVVAQVVVA